MGATCMTLSDWRSWVGRITRLVGGLLCSLWCEGLVPAAGAWPGTRENTEPLRDSTGVLCSGRDGEVWLVSVGGI